MSGTQLPQSGLSCVNARPTLEKNGAGTETSKIQPSGLIQINRGAFMKKFSVLVALLAALSFTAVTAMPTPAEAQKSGKKSGKKAKAAKVEVQKPGQPVTVQAYHYCVNSFGVFAVVGAVGCGAFWAVPVMVESFTVGRA
jgi:hypothetical protein